MSTITTDAESWVGSSLTDRDDHKLGTIEEIYFDEQTDQPLWMLVKTGRFGTRHSFVPLTGARPGRDAIVTRYDKRDIEQAPRVDPADDLPDDVVADLYLHYGLAYDGADGADVTRASAADRVLMYLDLS